MIEGAIENMLFRVIQESNTKEMKRIMKEGQKTQNIQERITGYIFAAWLSVPILAVVGLIVYPISLLMAG